MRAVVRAEAKQEITILAIANELLGKRLRTGADGRHLEIQALFSKNDLQRSLMEPMVYDWARRMG